MNYLYLKLFDLVVLSHFIQRFVCVHLFREEDIERTFKFHDGAKKVEMPKKKITLKKFAVPSIFPNFPSYLTDETIKPQRLSWDQWQSQSVCDALACFHGPRKILCVFACSVKVFNPEFEFWYLVV